MTDEKIKAYLALGAEDGMSELRARVDEWDGMDQVALLAWIVDGVDRRSTDRGSK